MTEPDHEFTGEPLEADVSGAGLRIHYLDWGPAPGPAIVFLHGGGLNAHTWDVVCDLLHRDYRCIALDLRGHGDSDWHDEGDYSLEAHADDLAAALGALALRRLVLIGMSLGGAVALTWAARHPDDLLGLVLVDMGPGGSRPAGGRRLGAFMQGPDEFASLDEVVDRALAFNPRRSPERLRRTLIRNLRQTAHGTWIWKYDRRFPGRAFDRAVPEEERRRIREERTQRLWNAARTISCPALVVRGGESDMFLDEDAERTAAAFADGRWVTIAGASHTVQSDSPAALSAVLREFIAALPDAR
jgi:pimeloyl-ACP methyl ester carboxylesterase